MAIARRAFVSGSMGCASLLLACQAAPLTASGAKAVLTLPLPPPRSSSLVVAGPALPSDPCVSLTASMALEAQELNESDSPQQAQVHASERIRAGRCYRNSRGAWAVGLVHANNDGGPSHEPIGAWAIAHVDAAGVRTQVVPNLPRSNLPAGYNYAGGETALSIAIEEPVLFDYDTDGEPEIIVWGSGQFFDGERFTFGWVWTFAAGRIVPYAPSAGFEVVDAKDVDGDGRPDLQTGAPFESVFESVHPGFNYVQSGPRFLAHSREGGSFSQTDTLAQDFVRLACPRAPALLVVRRIENGVSSVDDDASFQAIACARVWGSESKRLKPQIAKQCGKFKRVPDPLDPNSCDHQPAMLDWATRSPPVTLR
jgi:hypothetical protein